MKALGEQTFKRYNRAWLKFLALASAKRSFTSIRDLDNIPISSLAYWLIHFSGKASFAEARCAYEALLLFSGAHALRFEPILKGIKKRWNYSVPRYVVYYDVPKLLQQLPYLEASGLNLKFVCVSFWYCAFSRFFGASIWNARDARVSLSRAKFGLSTPGVKDALFTNQVQSTQCRTEHTVLFIGWEYTWR